MPAMYPGQGMQGDRAYLSLKEYREYRDVSLEIMKEHSLAETLFVPLGRSPVPIAAFLQNLNLHSARTFPVSGIGGKSPLREDQKEILLKQLEVFLPITADGRLETADGRVDPRTKIVLVDYVGEGVTLTRMQKLVNRYLSSKKAQLTVDVIGLRIPRSDGPNAPPILGSGGRPIRVIDLGPYPALADALRRESFHRVAQYPKFTPGSDTPRMPLAAPAQEPGPYDFYGRFFKAMGARMKRDRALATLSGAPPPISQSQPN
jgi:hypothetical protein